MIARLIPAFFVFAALLCAGELTQRYKLNLTRVLSGGPPPYTVEVVLADVIPTQGRRFTEYSGDVSGRYVGALAISALESRQSYPQLDALVTKILALQKPEGYFGARFNTEKMGFPESALLWGNGRLLTGLLEYYSLNQRPDVLAAARKLGDFMIRIGPALNSADAREKFDALEYAAGYITWTSDLEGVVALYRATGDEKYRTLAGQMTQFILRKPSQHAHGYLTTMRGVVALYEATRDPKYLKLAETAWSEVVDTGNVLVDGAVGERFLPDLERTEGCTEADWLRLSLALWRLTGKPRYLEAAERTLFNEFALNEFANGDFGSRVLSSGGLSMATNREGEGTGQAWWCCTLHGLRAFPDVLASALRLQNEAIYLDLPTDGVLAAGKLVVTADSALSTTASVRVTFDRTDGKEHTLLIREPAWSRGITVKVNGAAVESQSADGYRKVSKPWKDGDTIEVAYGMRTRIVRDQKTGRVAFFHGPWLLGIDAAMNPDYFNEPFRTNALEVRPAADGSVALTPDPGAADPFAIPVARFRVPYRHGGYPMLQSYAVLRPVAEQTGVRAVPWEWWLQLQGEK
jgi:DUF1680 family protein